MRQSEETVFEPVIGVEVHVEPKTVSKMFCPCSADYFRQPPNTLVCPICLGLPGTMPTPNGEAIKRCITMGLALGCRINQSSKFDRKHYFYPDLPKGFQISQYDRPFCERGNLMFNRKRLRIRRVHMEEDTAKLTHERSETRIDFNRSGVPLIEIVSEPDIQSSWEARQFLQELQHIIRYTGISEANMERGTMRCEVNISLRQVGNSDRPPYKVEIKNLNSFRSVEKALEYEIGRQAKLLEEGKQVPQETRGWDERKVRTRTQRRKEEAQDYRYFPEPDIPPIEVTEEELKNLQAQLPELPEERKERFTREFKISREEAQILTRERAYADLFEETVQLAKQQEIKVPSVASFMIQKPGKVLGKTAPQIVDTIHKSTQITATEDEIGKAVEAASEENKKALEDVLSGKQEALGFLMGQVNRRLAGKPDPRAVRRILLEKIDQTAKK